MSASGRCAGWPGGCCGRSLAGSPSSPCRWGYRPRTGRGLSGALEWAWWTRATAEPPTTRAQVEAGTPIGKAKKGSRPVSDRNTHPATRRTYRMRSYVICDLCGRRLYGKTRYVGDVYSYYACEPVPAHHAGKDWFPTHPKSLWVREDKLLTAVR